MLNVSSFDKIYWFHRILYHNYSTTEGERVQADQLFLGANKKGKITSRRRFVEPVLQCPAWNKICHASHTGTIAQTFMATTVACRKYADAGDRAMTQFFFMHTSQISYEILYVCIYVQVPALHYLPTTLWFVFFCSFRPVCLNLILLDPLTFAV